MKILDTTFLIDLQRERKRKFIGSAHQYLSQNATNKFYISTISVTEYEEGFPDSELAAVRRFLGAFGVLDVTLDTARIAGRIRRTLRSLGQIIGDHDILIAATAIACNATLLTDNTNHFARIEGLQVMAYKLQ